MYQRALDLDLGNTVAKDALAKLGVSCPVEKEEEEEKEKENN